MFDALGQSRRAGGSRVEHVSFSIDNLRLEPLTIRWGRKTLVQYQVTFPLASPDPFPPSAGHDTSSSSRPNVNRNGNSPNTNLEFPELLRT